MITTKINASKVKTKWIIYLRAAIKQKKKGCAEERWWYQSFWNQFLASDKMEVEFYEIEKKEKEGGKRSILIEANKKKDN